MHTPATLPELFSALPVLLAVILALLFLISAQKRLMKYRLLAAGAHGMISLLLFGSAAVLALISTNLYTYHRLTYEQDVAKIKFIRLGKQHFQAEMTLAGDKEPRQFDLRGDEWQIDARIIKWKSAANLLGLNPRYRLERLSGRYHDIAKEETQIHTAYQLSRNFGFDLWSLAHQYEEYLGWIDTLYGSAAYMPMADQAGYDITITTTGLLIRAENETAREAVKSWF